MRLEQRLPPEAKAQLSAQLKALKEKGLLDGDSSNPRHSSSASREAGKVTVATVGLVLSQCIPPLIAVKMRGEASQTHYMAVAKDVASRLMACAFHSPSHSPFPSPIHSSTHPPSSPRGRYTHHKKRSPRRGSVQTVMTGVTNHTMHTTTASVCDSASRASGVMADAPGGTSDCEKHCSLSRLSHASSVAISEAISEDVAISVAISEGDFNEMSLEPIGRETSNFSVDPVGTRATSMQPYFRDFL